MASRVRPFTPVVYLSVWLAAAALSAFPVWSEERFDNSDWLSFVISGRAFERGLDPYSVPASVARTFGPDIPAGVDRLNLNPPPALFLFGPISRAPARTTGMAVWAVSIVCLGLALYLAGAFRSAAGILIGVWTLYQPGFETTLILGQVYGLLALLVASAFCLAERRGDALAGAVVGALCAIKPNFLLLVVVLICADHMRIAIAALATFALANAAVFAFADGPSLYAGWFRAVQATQALGWGASLKTMLTVLGRPDWFWLLGPAVAAAAFAVCRVSKPASPEAIWIGAALAVFVTPVGWVGYNLCLVPFIARRGAKPLIACAMLSFVPLRLESFAPQQRVLLYSLGLLAILGQTLHDAWRRWQPASSPPVFAALRPAPRAAHVPRLWTDRPRG